MKFILIPNEELVVKDSTHLKFDFSDLIDPDITEVHWNGTKGRVTYKNKNDAVIKDMAEFQSILDIFEVELASSEAIHQSELENRSYKEKRKSDYPEIGDQLDGIWDWFEESGLVADESANEGTAAKILANIKSVKAKYPKE